MLESTAEQSRVYPPQSPCEHIPLTDEFSLTPDTLCSDLPPASTSILFQTEQAEVRAPFSARALLSSKASDRPLNVGQLLCTGGRSLHVTQQGDIKPECVPLGPGQGRDRKYQSVAPSTGRPHPDNKREALIDPRADKTSSQGTCDHPLSCSTFLRKRQDSWGMSGLGHIGDKKQWTRKSSSSPLLNLIRVTRDQIKSTQAPPKINLGHVCCYHTGKFYFCHQLCACSRV